MPIRIMAALCLKQFLKKQEAVDFIRPELERILVQLLEMMREMDHDELVSCL